MQRFINRPEHTCARADLATNIPRTLDFCAVLSLASRSAPTARSKLGSCVQASNQRVKQRIHKVHEKYQPFILGTGQTVDGAGLIRPGAKRSSAALLVTVTAMRVLGRLRVGGFSLGGLSLGCLRPGGLRLGRLRLGRLRFTGVLSTFAVAIVWGFVRTLGSLGGLMGGVSGGATSRLTALGSLVPVPAMTALWGRRVRGGRVVGNTARLCSVPVPSGGRARLATEKRGLMSWRK